MYALKRLLVAIPTVIGVSILVFLMIHLIPGDPAQMMLFPRGTEAEIEQLRQELGLNLPIHVQYWNWVTDAIQLDLGTSVQRGVSVTSEVFGRFPATFELAIAAILIAVIVGVPLGVIAAQKRNSWIDYTCITISLMGVSIPVFWLGLMLIFIFAATLGVLPVSGRMPTGASIESVTGLYLIDTLIRGDLGLFWQTIRHLFLPALSLASVPLALVVRVTRSSMIEVLSEDYVRTAKAKGTPYRLVVFKHALRNALIPVITVVGLQVGRLMGGAILTETVFSWPGMGRLLVSSIHARDYPLIQGTVLIFAILFIITNIVVDLLYAYIDPRVKYE
ncbi:ABC transporter permease [Natranaerobius thermophilus JW/NM-WN-LF]|uniref:Binding-protein-dependent transport systems inner membrane component n=1 Tax=Natranaerobius thermophilus (strain ATCC BAA-1301 / DSM 18059 / JW/NM-WN-LF) TaxID=457570 RepID=B2A288_NATTJ|nr:ABC transporter permease [Natranaerobius thermophilus]ACB86196.1 binding-protein-dependent transport systems inner membrane component [Natranaerobius thermophilus JW/NM-WN-LF]